MNTAKALLISLLFAGSCNLYAANGYAGAGIGESFVDQGVFGEMDTAYKIFGGVQFHPNFAVEAAYMDLGKPVEDFFGFRQEYDVWAAALWAKGIWPVTQRIELFGKLGIAYWEYDKVTRLGSLPPTTSSSSATDYALGLGLSIVVAPHWKIPLEYEQFHSDLDKAGMFSVSVAYQF